jgi:hypothetical protein
LLLAVAKLCRYKHSVYKVFPTLIVWGKTKSLKIFVAQSTGANMITILLMLIIVLAIWWFDKNFFYDFENDHLE